MEIFKDKKIILGSKSPRRSQLLHDAGFEFEIRYQDVDEDFASDIPPIEVAEMLAKRKAETLQKTLHPNEILITADSVVILDDVIYNKPSNKDEAIAMLTVLSNREHCVATGVCLASLQKMQAFTSLTYVAFDPMSMDEITYYIDRFKPFDKAGSYGIQDWIGLCKVNSIRGSYSNVMGLPIRDLYQALIRFIE
ncbi:MAG: Maf family protein [Chitinophagales bacterium]|nr:Maf family protein [Chitinophagales bacterium]